VITFREKAEGGRQKDEGRRVKAEGGRMKAEGGRMKELERNVLLALLVELDKIAAIWKMNCTMYMAPYSIRWHALPSSLCLLPSAFIL